MAGFSATQRILRAMLRNTYDTSEMSNSHGFSRLSSMLEAIQSGEHGYVDGRIEGLSHMYFTLYPYDPSDRVLRLVPLVRLLNLDPAEKDRQKTVFSSVNDGIILL